MSFLSSLFAWASVPFTVALGVAVVFVLLQATGVLSLLAGGGDNDGDADGDADHDGSADHDVDHDADGGDHDVDHDADGDGDGDGDDADHDADNEADHAGQHGVGHQILADLGVGRAPMSILWQTFAASFGFAGLATNIFYAQRVGSLPTQALLFSLPIAFVFAYAVTRGVSRVVGKLISNPNQEATSRKQLVGQSGVVISSKVNDEFGEVRLHDKTGHVLRIICRTRPSEKAILEGREVVIVEYDRERDQLFVAPLDDDDDIAPPKPAAPQARVASTSAPADALNAAAEDEALAAQEAATRRDRAP